MSAIIDFLVNAHILDFAADPRVLVAAAALFLVSLVMRWKVIALSLFGAAALVAVARYSRLAEGKAYMDQNLLVFALGTFLVVVILVYFLFIRGD